MHIFKSKFLNIFTVICSLTLMFALAGCSTQQSSSNTASSNASPNAAAGYNGEALKDIKVASMKGPTSIGLAYLMENKWGDFTVCASADEVAPLLLQGKVDIACVPANLASTLYKKTDGKIRVLDINTLGVLYVVTGDPEINSIGSLKGHTIYMTGKGTVPEYTVKAVLESAGLSPSDVEFEFKSEPSEVASILSADPKAIAILPQPYATAVTMKIEGVKQVIDLTDAWTSGTGGLKGELVTGVTVALADYVDSHNEQVEAFIQGQAVSVRVANEDPDAIASTVADLGIIDNEQLAIKAIPKCNVVCISGGQMQGILSGYLHALYEQDPASIGGSMPGDDFYYGAEIG